MMTSKEFHIESGDTKKYPLHGYILKSISNTRGPKDMALFHLLVIFENQNGFEM